MPQLEVVSAFNVESTKGGDAGQGWPAVAEGGGKPLRRHSAKLWVTVKPRRFSGTDEQGATLMTIHDRTHYRRTWSASVRRLSAAAVAIVLVASALTLVGGVPQSAAAGVTNLYVANGNNSITEYAYGANGNVAPVATIQGASTGLIQPWSLALDTSDDLWVSNLSGQSVTAYAPGASGNVAPIVAISGSNNQLNLPAGLALDGRTGRPLLRESIIATGSR